MKVDDLIKELEKFKEEYGNLEVGISRINSAYEEIAYYSDIVIFKASKSKLFTDYDYETIDYDTDTFCALG